MHGFRAAKNQSELDKVDTFKYDNNFNNWEDPKVMEMYTKSDKSMKRTWKKSYGLEHVHSLRQYTVNIDEYFKEKQIISRII